MNDYNKINEAPRPKFDSMLLVIGIGIVLLGCLLALEELTSLRFGGIRVMRFWPIIIVAVGVVKLFEDGLRSVSGWIITAVGALLLTHSVTGRSLGDLIGPFILVVVGIFIVLHALKRHRKVPPELLKSGDFVQGRAILGAYKYKPYSGQFDGGEITAILGGFGLDLRQTTMKHETTRIDVFVLFGGGEIRVPEDWDVSVEASAIAGGVDDKTVNPPVSDSSRPKLLITGSVLFGGLEVKCSGLK